MTLKELLSVVKTSNVCIMAINKENDTRTIFKGERKSLKINEYDESLKVSFAECSKTNIGELFIMVDD